jgi:thiamine-phosphate pyrophosphorylase
MTPCLDETRGFVQMLTSALAAGDVAAVLVRLAESSERALIDRVKALAPAVQSRGVALLVEGHPEIVVRAGADGAHMHGIEAVTNAIDMLKPERIVGAGALTTRHDAMLAGEKGADYLMFGEPDALGHRPAFAAVLERVAWWAQVFQPPCVGYAASLDELDALAEASAEFIAVDDLVWRSERGPTAAIRLIAERLAMERAQ